MKGFATPSRVTQNLLDSDSIVEKELQPLLALAKGSDFRLSIAEYP
jgi:hypothetical protein